MTSITWENAKFLWNSNTYTWDEVQLISEILEVISGGGNFDEEIYKYDAPKKRKLVKLILKLHGNTITEQKEKEIKQYKITAKDIKLAVKEVLGVEMIAEGVSF
tara:strand:+ start:387 stop:698 length:312 start_codon:yes stop_codon:yes gene_type:complete